MLIHLLSELLRKALKRLGELLEWNEYWIKYILKSCNDVLLDGVERPIQRPKANDLQKARYSGKKTHNVKNNLLSLPDRRIIRLSKTVDENVHDKKICDNQPIHFPSGIT
ncbi:MAG TPA: transposase family protein [Ignavibacteria bacterium]